MTVNKTVFGITGPSGSGKGYVSDIFRQHGVSVFDGDLISREVVERGKPANRELFEHFGSEYFAEDGTLLRRKLAGKVFSDESELRILNKIVHKYIKKEIEDRLLSSSPVCAIDGAVIIGSDIEDMCEFLVGVIAPRELRMERLKERDGISEDEIKRRMDAQPDDDFYIKRCRYIIKNDGSCDVENEVKKILEDIR